MLYAASLPFTPLCMTRSLESCTGRLGLAPPPRGCCGGGTTVSARCPGLTSVRIARRRLGGFCVEVSCPGNASCMELGSCRRPEIVYCGHCVAVVRCGDGVYVVDALEGAAGPRLPWECGEGLRVVNTVEGVRRCVALPRLQGVLELLRSSCGLAVAEIVDLVYPYVFMRLVSSSGLTYYLGAVLRPSEAPLARLSVFCPRAAPRAHAGPRDAPGGAGASSADALGLVIREARVVGVGGVPRFLAVAELQGDAPYPWRLRCRGDCSGGFLDGWGRVVLSFGPEGGTIHLEYRGRLVEAGHVALACGKGRLVVHASSTPLVAVEPITEDGCVPLVVLGYGAGLVDGVEGVAVLRLTGSWEPLWPPGIWLNVGDPVGLEAWLSPRGLGLRCRSGYCVAGCGDRAEAGTELHMPLGSALHGCSVLVCGPRGCREAWIKPEEVVAAAIRLAVLLASELSELAEDIAPNILDTRKLLDYASILDILP